MIRVRQKTSNKKFQTPPKIRSQTLYESGFPWNKAFKSPQIVTGFQN